MCVWGLKQSLHKLERNEILQTFGHSQTNRENLKILTEVKV